MLLIWLRHILMTIHKKLFYKVFQKACSTHKKILILSLFTNLYAILWVKNGQFNFIECFYYYFKYFKSRC